MSTPIERQNARQDSRFGAREWQWADLVTPTFAALDFAFTAQVLWPCEPAEVKGHQWCYPGELSPHRSKHSSRVMGTLERRVSPELVEDAGEPLSVWMSVGETQGRSCDHASCALGRSCDHTSFGVGRSCDHTSFAHG